MSESDPIRVYTRSGRWVISYGNYTHSWHDPRADAIDVATAAAQTQGRELRVDPEIKL